jgi:hypothetical protein
MLCQPRQQFTKAAMKAQSATRLRFQLQWVNLDRPNDFSTVSYPIDQLPNRKLLIA